MRIAISISVIATITLAAADPAFADPVTCPRPETLALSVAAPGWISISSSIHPHGAPAIDFENIWTDGFDVRCTYRVRGSGILSLANKAECKPSKGNWKEQGIARLCEALTPDQCILECLKKRS